MAFCGEDIYGVHSIEYNAVPEDETFYAFGCRLIATDYFSGWRVTEFMARAIALPVVPKIHEAVFSSERELEAFIKEEQDKESILGGPREGIVVRTFDGFSLNEISRATLQSQ